MKTVFAVEDDTALVDLLGKTLADYGYAMSSSPRVSGSFEKMKELHPSMVFLDVMLPDGAGYQVSRRIRMDREVYRTPVLFISSMCEAPEIEYALQQGGDLYLTKPFSLKQILDKVAKLEDIATDINHDCQVTGLPGLAALERELDCRIFLAEPVTLILFTLENFQEYRFAKGMEMGQKALQCASQALKDAARDLPCGEPYLAHPGGYHFFAALAPEDATALSQYAQLRFEQHRAELYRDFELKDGYIVVSKRRNTYAGYPIMSFTVETLTPKAGEHLTGSAMVYHLGRVHKHTPHDAERRLFRWDQGKKW